MKDRAEYFTKMFNIGSLNPNEIRAYEELNPYDGGDEYRVPMNTEQPGVITDANDSGVTQ